MFIMFLVPDVNFQLSTYIATINVPIEAICTATDTGVRLEIAALNGTELAFTETTNLTGQMILNFSSSTPGTYVFSCLGTNSFGNSETRAEIIVRSFTENLKEIDNITADTELKLEQAMRLLSVSNNISIY